MEFRDRHHVLAHRREWTLRPEGKYLRGIKSLIPLLLRELHEDTHANTPPVPVPSYLVLRRMAYEYEPSDDTLRSMDNLMSTIESVVERPNVKPLEKELALLTVQAIDLQRPFIRRGLWNNTER